MVKSLLFAGVGGQGLLLAGKVMGKALTSLGYDVKVSEVHGMSQRGGSVVVCVRYGDKVFSPVIEEGGADVVIAFEKLEAARYLPFLKEGGIVVANTQQIDPMPVTAGNSEYPEAILSELKAKSGRLIALDAAAAARSLGNVKAVNSIMLGVLSSLLDLEENIWMQALKESVKPDFLELNMKAFEYGKKAVNL
jgi:indolepyruvate ferredoxin oxidoreductase beta subunit